MFAAPASWRHVIRRIGDLVEPVEQREVALAGHAERDLGAVDRELVGEQLAAGRLTARPLEVDVRALQLRLLLVGGVDVA